MAASLGDLPEVDPGSEVPRQPYGTGLRVGPVEEFVPRRLGCRFGPGSRGRIDSSIPRSQPRPGGRVVMAVAERTKAQAIATLDERHFGAVVLRGAPRLRSRELLVPSIYSRARRIFRARRLSILILVGSLISAFKTRRELSTSLRRETLSTQPSSSTRGLSRIEPGRYSPA